MKRQRECFHKERPNAEELRENSGCREFDGEDLSKLVLRQPMTRVKSTTKTCRSSGWSSRWSRSGCEKNRKKWRNKPILIRLMS